MSGGPTVRIQIPSTSTRARATLVVPGSTAPRRTSSAPCAVGSARPAPTVRARRRPRRSLANPVPSSQALVQTIGPSANVASLVNTNRRRGRARAQPVLQAATPPSTGALRARAVRREASAPARRQSHWRWRSHLALPARSTPSEGAAPATRAKSARRERTILSLASAVHPRAGAVFQGTPSL